MAIRLSWSMITFVAVAEGINLWLRDLFTEHLPIAFFASDMVWLAALICVFLFGRYPLLAVVVGWLQLLSFVVMLQPYYVTHTPIEFLYRHGFEFAYLAFAHLGWYYKRRTISEPV